MNTVYSVQDLTDQPEFRQKEFPDNVPACNQNKKTDLLKGNNTKQKKDSLPNPTNMQQTPKAVIIEHTASTMSFIILNINKNYINYIIFIKVNKRRIDLRHFVG